MWSWLWRAVSLFSEGRRWEVRAFIVYLPDQPQSVWVFLSSLILLVTPLFCWVLSNQLRTQMPPIYSLWGKGNILCIVHIPRGFLIRWVFKCCRNPACMTLFFTMKIYEHNLDAQHNRLWVNYVSCLIIWGCEFGLCSDKHGIKMRESERVMVVFSLRFELFSLETFWFGSFSLNGPWEFICQLIYKSLLQLGLQKRYLW